MALPDLDHLTPEDAEILALEEGPIAGHTLKMAIADRPHAAGDPLEALRARVEHGIAHVPRCRERLVPTPLGIATPAWLPDPEFDLAAHVRRRSERRPVDEATLYDVVARAMEDRLPRDRPLWTLDLVELEGDRVAYILKTHHCMADGSGALRIAAALLWDEERDATAGQRPARGPVAGTTGSPASVALFASGVRSRVRGAGRTAQGLARTLGSRPERRALETALGRVPATVRRELHSVGDPGPFDVPVGRARSVASTRASLEDVRRAGRAVDGATVNDVLLAVVAGGLRRWLSERREGVPELRVKVPVSMHHGDEGPAAIGNRDSFFFVDLPLDEPDGVRRLEIVRSETAERKRDHDADTLYLLFTDLSHVSRRALRRATAIAGRPGVFSLCVSNVRGHAEPVTVLGGRVHELHAVAEIGARHGLRVGALSYAGAISLGLCADAAAVPDLGALAGCLEASLEELVAAAPTPPRPAPRARSGPARRAASASPDA